MAEYHYYEGRPQANRDHQWSACSNLSGSCGCLLPIMLTLNFLGLIYVGSILTVILSIIGNILIATILGAIWSAFRNIRRDRGSIVPYFKKPTDGSLGVAWLSGRALSRNCEVLDGSAIRLDKRPLSSFGFFDDMRREKVIWHDATDGLQTIETLLQGIDEVPELAVDREAVRSDLEMLRMALEKARATGNPFALLVRFEEGSVSGLEMDQREGSFW